MHRKGPAYAGFCTHTQDGTCTRINWRTITHTQEQACIRMNTGWACKNMSAHAGPNLHIQEQTHNLFSTKTQPKHVPTPPKVSGFHLNLSHSKTQAFTSLKTYQNGRSKEKLNNKKSLKNLLIRSLHSPKGVVVICTSRKEPSSALLLHSNRWDGRHQWKGCRNSSWT